MNLLGLSGSLRSESTNTLLIREAARLFQPDNFVEADLNLPLYSGDTEAEGIPAPVQTLSDQIAAADAVIVATPEYNKGISGVMKNALDWVSRTEAKPWAGKPVAIMSTTAGRTGGERAQAMLRLCLQPFQPVLLQGPDVLVAANFKEFNDDGQLTNEQYLTALQTLMDKLKASV
ncbi:NADPH-dependent FMN reductase [Algirhabdus cladophorae]|uniref:NADPH-dependent FMN reductase n=1 Tax=Algirhabdus cladophorae TaxID=3377108 RepID=UPI003B84631D